MNNEMFENIISTLTELRDAVRNSGKSESREKNPITIEEALAQFPEIKEIDERIVKLDDKYPGFACAVHDLIVSFAEDLGQNIGSITKCLNLAPVELREWGAQFLAIQLKSVAWQMEEKVRRNQKGRAEREQKSAEEKLTAQKKETGAKLRRMASEGSANAVNGSDDGTIARDPNFSN